jgi:hypothetical protein
MIKAIYSEVLVINASYQITTILHFRRRGNHQQPTNTWTIKGNIIDKKQTTQASNIGVQR